MRMDPLEIEDYIEGLRDLADFLEENPDLLERLGSVRLYHAIYDYEDDPAKPRMQHWARRLAPCEKNYTGMDFELNKRFGPHLVQVYTLRENVCKKIVVGTKRVERTTYTAEDQQKIDNMNKVTVYEDEEVVEWQCPPSLLGDS